jgi:tetratricopeptide (TPR) repeat protein
MADLFIAYDDARHDLLTAAAYLAERIKGGDGHAAAVSAIVPRYLAQNNVDLAAELANAVEDPFTRDKLLTIVAEKCAELDDDEYAMQLSEAIEEFGLQQQALEHIALEKVRKGQTEKALEIAASVQHPDFIYASAAVRISSDGGCDEAADMLSRIEYPSARVSALLAIAIKRFAAGDKDKCIALLDEALATATEIEHNEERIRTLCEVGNHYVEAGRNDLAIGAYNTAKEEAEQLDNIHRDAFIAAAIMGFLHAGSADTADRTLDLVADKTQVANCLHAFSKFYWARNERDEALEALDEAYQILRSQRETETRDSRAKYALFGTLAAQFASFERGERAIEIASQIDEDSYRTSALTQVATVLTLGRDDEAARHALGAITGDADRAFALIAMSDAKEENGEHLDAVKLLDEASHLVEEVPQLTARSSAYNEIARRYKQHNETLRQLELSSRNLGTISQIRDESSRAVALAALADIVDGEGANLTDSDKVVLDQMLAKV